MERNYVIVTLCISFNTNPNQGVDVRGGDFRGAGARGRASPGEGKCPVTPAPQQQQQLERCRRSDSVQHLAAPCARDYGRFVPIHFRSRERNDHIVDDSFPGTKVHGNETSRYRAQASEHISSSALRTDGQTARRNSGRTDAGRSTSVVMTT